MSSVEERVKKIVVEQLGVKEDEVSNEASFVDDREKETTVLAAVKNYGRLFPYISSIVMSIGLLVHLLLNLPVLIKKRK